MSTSADTKDTEIQVKLGDQVIGTATLDNTIGTAPHDQYGTASVDVVLPEDTAEGNLELRLVGAQTGTVARTVIAVESAQVTPVENQTLPTISGTPRVGKVLTASDGTWTPAPETVTYQWFAGGLPIAGATAKTLRLTGPQAGKQITVRVTASAAGHTDGTATSLPTAPVARGPVTVSLRTSPSRVIVRNTRATVSITVTNPDGVAVTGLATVRVAGQTPKRVSLVNGRASVLLSRFPTRGAKTVSVRYHGSASLLPATTLTTVHVVRR